MRSAKSTRGGFCPGVFTSSMMLMPPTKAILPSTWQSLRCSRRIRFVRNCHGATSGRYLSSAHAASLQRALDRRRQIVPRAPAVDEHAHDDAALRGADERGGDDARRRRRRRRCRSRARLRAPRRRSRATSDGKVLASASQQSDAIAREEPVHRAAGARVERGGERRVIGDPSRGERVVDVRIEDRKAARVDAIEAEHGHHRRKRARRTPAHAREHLDDAELLDEQPVAPCAASR